MNTILAEANMDKSSAAKRFHAHFRHIRNLDVAQIPACSFLPANAKAQDVDRAEAAFIHIIAADCDRRPALKSSQLNLREAPLTNHSLLPPSCETL